MDFSHTLEIMLAYRHMTQADLANQIHTHKQVVNDFLRKRQDYRLNADIIRMSDALGYDVKLTFIDRLTGQKIDCM